MCPAPLPSPEPARRPFPCPTVPQDGSDTRFGSHAFVACPLHDPTAPGFDAAELRSEFAARDAAHAAACAPYGAACGPKDAACAPDELTAAAELLTGIRRASIDSGVFGGDAVAIVNRMPRCSASGGGHKRGRSPSGDGGSDGTRAGLSDEEAARVHHPHHDAVAIAGANASAVAAAAPAATTAAATATAERLAATTAAATAWAGRSDGSAAAAPETPPVRGQGGGEVGGLLSQLQLGAPPMQELQQGEDGEGGEASDDAEAQLGALLRAAGSEPVDLEALLERAAALTSAATLPGALLGGSTGHANRPGRCAVCIVQRKGKCGTESAPKKCMRRQQALQQARTALQQRLWQRLQATRDGEGEAAEDMPVEPEAAQV
jgi:hypothetical protein